MRSPALTLPRRRSLAALTVGALIASPLALVLADTASAASATIVINEAYVNGGSASAVYTNKYVELRNVTSSPIDFAVTPMSVQYRAPGSTGASTTTVALTGGIPANGYYTVQGGSNGSNGAAVPGVDQSSGLNPGAAGGTITLASGVSAVDPSSSALVVDKLGYGTSNSPETSAASGNSIALSIQRVAADNDNNSAEFTAQTPTPDAGNTVAPAALEATFPGNKSGVVGSPITGFSLTASGGTVPYAWMATGLPPGIDVASDGAVSGTPTAPGTYEVTATATDSATTPASDPVMFTFTITEPGAVMPIAEIQGTGASTPRSGQTVTTRGVVTASYPTGGLNGFYLQTPGADTAEASDAIFIYGGTSGFATYPAVGDSVEVTGTAGEFSGATQITATGVTAVAALGTVAPKTHIPGTACALPGTACLEGAALDAAREAVEGELFQPTAPWTVTDSYDGSPDLRSSGANDGAFLGELAVAAESDDPLVTPTEIIDAQATSAINDRKRYNAAHRLILDDASSWSYVIPFTVTEHASDPLPWFTPDHTVRTGAGMTFLKPVVFTQRLASWRILPQAQVVGKPTGMLEFEQDRPAAPEEVGGDVTLATFNVLNFFPTTGEEFVASGLGTCTYYTDRAGNNITNNRCNPDGPRGAANEVNLKRQRDKIVAAINTADADIVSLEELENSVKYNKPRDFAINELVAALNADAGAGTWAAVASAPVLPPTAEQDVIRNGFIYQPANVALVGDSVVLSDESSTGEAFADAREPVAQAFKQVGTPDADAFAVIVNHFKSKGSGTADPDGQGNATDQRVAQATSLVWFANTFKSARSIARVFLAGDFNAYSEEDPIQVLNAAGYTNLESTSDPEEETYTFDGMVGSLDHVLANEAALGDVNAVDVWDINGYESVYYEYSRINSNVTNLYAVTPFRSSDHSPEIIGINTPPSTPAPAPVADTTVTGTAAPVVYGTAGSVAVTVVPATATGTVTLSLAGVVVGTTALTAGAGTIGVPAKALPAGTYQLALTYSGDAGHKPSTGSVKLVVTKAKADVTAKVKPRKVVVRKTRARIVVRVEADGYTPTGDVRVRVAGRTYLARLVDGRAVVKLKKLAKPRTYKAKVRYLGDANTEPARTTATFKAKPKAQRR